MMGVGRLARVLSESFSEAARAIAVALAATT